MRLSQCRNDEWAAWMVQIKLHELLGGVAGQMLAEDGITVDAYTADPLLCRHAVARWAAAAQDLFVARSELSASPSGELIDLAQLPKAGLTSAMVEPAPATLPTQEHITHQQPAANAAAVETEAAQLQQRPVPVNKPARAKPVPQTERVGAPPGTGAQEFGRVEKMGPPEVSFAATRIHRRTQRTRSRRARLSRHVAFAPTVDGNHCSAARCWRSQVAAWLRSVNLGRYAAFVEEHEVDGDTLLDLAKVTRLVDRG